MSEPKPNRPWWRERRWRLVVAFWLAWPIIYIVGLAPVGYCTIRGWLPPQATRYYSPVAPFAARFPTLAYPIQRYLWWGIDWGVRHKLAARQAEAG